MKFPLIPLCVTLIGVLGDIITTTIGLSIGLGELNPFGFNPLREVLASILIVGGFYWFITYLNHHIAFTSQRQQTFIQKLSTILLWLIVLVPYTAIINNLGAILNNIRVITSL